MPRKLSKKQKALARVAKPRNKITGADFKKLKKKKTRGLLA
jgi:hypothetical protein